MLLFGAAFIIATTAFYHSWLGERRIVAPLMALDSRAFSQRARRSLRFTWHLAAALMLLSAAAIAWPDMPTDFVRLVGGFYLLLGTSLSGSRRDAMLAVPSSPRRACLHWPARPDPCPWRLRADSVESGCTVA